MNKAINLNVLVCSIFLIQLGLVKKVAAFTVELYKSNDVIDSLDDADGVIGGTNLESISSGTYDVIDFRDVAYGTPWGHSSIDNFFPGTTGSPNIENYAVLVTAEIEITSADDWTFLMNVDDGSRLRIDDLDLIVDDSLHPNQDRLNTTYLDVGTYDLEIVMFDHTGVGALELWAAPGTHTAYNSSDFRLIGDVANGGIATVPWDFSPSTGIVLSFGLFGLNRYYRKYQNKHRTK